MKDYIMKTLKKRAVNISTVHPYIWWFMWEAVSRAKFLLPHDQSYHVFRKFIELKPSGLFIDIGANTGVSSLSIRKFSAEYRILAVEPNKALEPKLFKINKRDPNFEYRLVGVGAEPGHLSFFVPRFGAVVLHTFTSGNAEHIRAAVVESFGERVAAKLVFEEFHVDIITVDSLHADPSIIKIDAEGLDYEVLLGARKTIEENRPFIVVEVDLQGRDRVSSYLAELDYVETAYDPDGRQLSRDVTGILRPESGRRNLFAVPREFAAASVRGEGP